MTRLLFISSSIGSANTLGLPAAVYDPRCSVQRRSAIGPAHTRLIVTSMLPRVALE
jgi:hypothetical protein